MTIRGAGRVPRFSHAGTARRQSAELASRTSDSRYLLQVEV